MNYSGSVASREEWMDLVRGVSVFLVVLLHVLTIIKVDYGLHRPGFFVELVQMFALFRMPALVFVSGLLLGKSMRKGVLPYLTGKLRHILWPCVIWSAITIAVMPGMDLFRPSSVVGLVLGVHHLWYLGFILLFYVIALPLQAVNPLLVAAGALLLSFLSDDGGKYTERLFFLMAFFFAGAWVERHFDRWIGLIKSQRVWPMVLVLVACMTASGYLNLAYGPDYFPISIMMIVAVCTIASRIGDPRVAGALTYAGRNSIVFYVSHYAVIYITVRALIALGFSHPAAICAIAMATALLAGWGLVVMRNRFALFRALFEAPKMEPLPMFR